MESIRPASAGLNTEGTGPLRGLNARLASLERFGQPALRIFFGLDLMTHGLPKLLRINHGSMADPMAALPHLIGDVLHLPMPGVLAYVVMLLETFGALALALGFQTRVVASLMVVLLLCASGVHWPVWPWADRGMEMPVLMAVVAFFFAVRGAGGFSLDRRFGWER